jgi:hypothetical protein
MQLYVPRRRAPRKGCFDSTLSEVTAWVDHLPLVSIGQTTRLLYQALSDLNQQDISPQQRFQALELLRGPVEYVAGRMKRHFVGRALPLAPRKVRVARLSREITHMLATGYKIVVIDQIDGMVRQDGDLLVSSMHRAMRLLGSVLLKAYQVYEPYPESAWLEIHSLYRHAEQTGLHLIPVDDALLTGVTNSSISDTYKQILLLSLACPYRLRAAETEHVYQTLEHWAPLAELRPASDGSNALFVTDLDSDQPPCYLVFSHPGANHQTCRALDTRRLAEQVRRAPGKGDADHGRIKISNSTLRRLMLAWGVMPNRRYARVRDCSEVVMTVGLNSIHYFVSGEAAFGASPVGLDPHARSCPLGGKEHLDSEDAHQQRDQVASPAETDTGLGHGTSADDTQDPTAGGSDLPPIDTTHRAQSWKMVNVSAGGYCLLWNNPETTRAQVGELVGMREQSDPDTFHWRVGVIRWLKWSSSDDLQLGVQMLSPCAVAIAARPGTGDAEDESYEKGLLIPEITVIQQQASVLLPSHPFNVGDDAVANCQGRHVRIRLTKLVENTGSFAQFHFLPMGDVESVSGKEESQPDFDFDDLWKSL